jgi:predicted short-subunit dehydrogenase-like oxidoreductase (DUF2520 family)
LTESAKTIGIAGTGRIGQALGRLLHDRAGAAIVIAGRCAERAAAAAAFAGPGARTAALEDLPGAAGRILIAVADEAIGEVAGRLASAGMSCGIAMHTCGARGPEALRPLARAGVACGVLHPLQTVADPAQGVAALPGSSFLVDGDPAAKRWGAEIVACLGGRMLEVPPEGRTLYHAAAVLASNCMVALVAASAETLARAGVPGEQTLDALAPLVRSSISNALSMGPAAALTGPVRRGDFSTVSAHLEAIRPLSPATREIYRALSLEALGLAERAGLAPEKARRLEALLAGGAAEER